MIARCLSQQMHSSQDAGAFPLIAGAVIVDLKAEQGLSLEADQTEVSEDYLSAAGQIRRSKERRAQHDR